MAYGMGFGQNIRKTPPTVKFRGAGSSFNNTTTGVPKPNARSTSGFRGVGPAIHPASTKIPKPNTFGAGLAVHPANRIPDPKTFGVGPAVHPATSSSNNGLVKPITTTPVVDKQQELIPKVATAEVPKVVSTEVPEKETLPVLPEPQGVPPAKTYDTTAIGEQAMDKFSEYAMADEDPQVTAERDRLERNNLLRVEQSRRMAHGNAIRAGFQPGSAQYEQMMRETVSSAENQGISATNSFNDFVRSRRSDQQRELEGLAEGEFSRVGTQESREWNEFNQLVKFLPSDKAQQMLAVSKATGVDVTSAIGRMYDESGTIKPEYADMSQPELIRKGIEQSVELMTNNPDTGKAWVGNEKATYIDKFYSENFQNIIAPSQTQTGQAEEQKASKSRAEQSIESGDYSMLTEGDWNNFTDTQIIEAKSKGHFNVYDSEVQKGDNWSDLDNMNTSSATKYWREHNPISAAENKGKIIEKDGVLYIITDPLKVVDLGGDNKQISVMAKPVKGGPEISIKDSSRFEGTTASFFDDLF
jgi:hypothetical protein